jgi:hypothetical protein
MQKEIQLLSQRKEESGGEGGENKKKLISSHASLSE